MWLLIIFGVIAVISIVILVIYRRQVSSICRQLKFIEENDTNKIISTDLNYKEINLLAERLNEIIRKQHQLGTDFIRKDKQLKDTITNISHDIRTPLTSMKGYFKLLTESHDEDEKRRYIDIIEPRVNSLTDLLEQLFTYTKLQNEAYHLNMEKNNINKILYESIFSFYDDFKKRKIEPVVIIPEESVYAMIDEAGFRRVLQNLVKNAIDHGWEHIEIIMDYCEDRISILTKNKMYHNENIDIDKVFDRFYKADTARKQQSSGLGLSIAGELVKKMNGLISASIENDYFTIRLELLRVQ